MEDEYMLNVSKDGKNKHTVFIYIILYYLGLESNNNSLGCNSVIWVYGSRLDYHH